MDPHIRQKLSAEQFDAWIKELRTPHYPQITGVLARIDKGNNYVGMCALGALDFAVHGDFSYVDNELGDTLEHPSINDAKDYVPRSPYNVGVYGDVYAWNDNEKASFSTIADRLEAKRARIVDESL